MRVEPASNPDTTSIMCCPYCSHSTVSASYTVVERMLGTGERYEYNLCQGCGARFIADLQANMAHFYPPEYGQPPTSPCRDKLRAFLRLRLREDARILDVGTGQGAFVYRLKERGYLNASGIDPYAAGPSIRRAELADVPDDSVDVVTMHHVLEHVVNPAAELLHVSRVLASDGVALIRVPLADSWASGRYGADWVQHDPPRHLTVPTVRALVTAARRAGLHVREHWRDEGGWQSWASRLIARGGDPWRASRWVVRRARLFHGPFAAVRNVRGVGDQGCFVLVPEASRVVLHRGRDIGRVGN